ncbi:MerR family transcriptional regulator [Tepidibacillus marianensis]|uniref:MerR family transcriptional regulator n=1 Tax=Tepidibacillus marianensis TaxID=3131995 RepID=UPI0030CDF6F8
MYRIGELASLVNVSKRTIDYYTQLGLLDVTRSESNYRYYTEKTIEQLKLIEQYKKQHLPLEEIKERIRFVGNEPDSFQIEKILEKVHQLSAEMKNLESDILKLRPYLEGLNEEQVKMAMKHLSNQGMAFVQVLMILLGSM